MRRLALSPRRRASARCRPSPEWLEGRLLLSISEPSGPVPASLATSRNWISYSPSAPFDPDRGVFPTEAQLRTDLQRLFDEGWRGLVTYSLDGTLATVPRVAKEVGFSEVIAGLYWFDDAQLARERLAAVDQAEFIDGYVVGNEGLFQNRYTRQELETEIASLKAATGRPVTTTETEFQYRQDPTLLDVGDWAFPTMQTWFPPASIRDPATAVASVESNYQELVRLAPDRTVIAKESWWPTDGQGYNEPAATEANQVAFYRDLAASPVRFVWGEAYDQTWKTAEGPQGPHWGFHRSDGTPKAIVSALASTYTDAYLPRPGTPRASTAGDYDGDGQTDLATYRYDAKQDRGLFEIKDSTTGMTRTAAIAGAGSAAVPVSGDFDGDGKADVAVVDPQAIINGGAAPNATVWSILLSGRAGRADQRIDVPFGGAGTLDRPAPADYDGDGRTDIATFRATSDVTPDAAQWFVLPSAANPDPSTRNGAFTVIFGAPGGADLPAVADFDSDGKADIAVFRPIATAEDVARDPALAGQAQWFVLPSKPNGRNYATTVGGFPVVFGASGNADQPAVADYNGDGRAEIVAFRSTSELAAGHSQWFILPSSGASPGFGGGFPVTLGDAGQIAAPGDYDRDGLTDLAVFDAATGRWALGSGTSGSARQRRVDSTPTSGAGVVPVLAPLFFRLRATGNLS